VQRHTQKRESPFALPRPGAPLWRLSNASPPWIFFLERATCIDNPEQAKTVPCRPIETAPAISAMRVFLVFDMLCIKKKNLSGNPVLRKKIGRPKLSLLAPCNGHETGAYGNGREAEDHWHQHDCPKHRCSSLLRISPTSGATGAGHRRHLARSRGPVLCQSPQAKPSLRSAPPHLE
jgi:hypothetical protein